MKTAAGKAKPIPKKSDLDLQYEFAGKIIEIVNSMNGNDALKFALVVLRMEVVKDERCKQAIIIAAVARYNATLKPGQPRISFQDALDAFNVASSDYS